MALTASVFRAWCLMTQGVVCERSGLNPLRTGPTCLSTNYLGLVRNVFVFSSEWVNPRFWNNLGVPKTCVIC